MPAGPAVRSATHLLEASVHELNLASGEFGVSAEGVQAVLGLGMKSGLHPQDMVAHAHWKLWRLSNRALAAPASYIALPGVLSCFDERTLSDFAAARVPESGERGRRPAGNGVGFASAHASPPRGLSCQVVVGADEAHEVAGRACVSRHTI